MSAATLVRRARLVRTGASATPDGPVDVRIVDGVITEVAAGLTPAPDDLVVDAAGRWAIPGLWDQHVHLTQWAQTRARLDVSATSGPAGVTAIVREHLAGLPAAAADRLVVGAGFRSAGWHVQPTVAELDAVSAGHRVVLISGDGHNGWLNSAALRFFGLEPRAGAVDENDWFPVFAQLADLPESRHGLDRAHRDVVEDAARLGVVGVVDFEFGRGYLDWPGRVQHGLDVLRVRTATYDDHLDEVVAAGLRTGDPLPGGAGLATMGPLKIISDGSLNTRTASCCQPYLDADTLDAPRGKQNYTLTELTALLHRAGGAGLHVAVHAIGDAAVQTALDAFAATGATGSVEHAQLVRWPDLARMAALGVRASVQPAHLIDDRDVTHRYWRDRADRCFAFRSMLRAGVRLAMGSDAPVAPLDPWLAMAAAVHRSGDGRDPWNDAEALTPGQALAASTDQQDLRPGDRGDVVIVDQDPLADSDSSAVAAEGLRGVQVAATLIGGRPTHLALP